MIHLILAAALCSNLSAPFTGTLCTPNDGKKHAAMLLFGGSEGGNSMSKLAKRFAENGYVAASVAYFKMPGLPPDLIDVPVETVKPAIDTLRARKDTTGRIGVMGMSKGGEFTLLVASTYPQITAAVAVVPSPYAYMGLNEQDRPTACSWTKSGKELPCIPADAMASMQIGLSAASGQLMKLTPLYDASRKADAKVTSAAMFPLEKIKGPVLCLGGMDDQMWPSAAQCDDAIAYLKAHHHAYRDREINYPNAGHTFILATHGPKSAMISYTWQGGGFDFGGTPQGDADAATQSWNQIWAFLKTALKN